MIGEVEREEGCSLMFIFLVAWAHQMFVCDFQHLLRPFFLAHVRSVVENLSYLLFLSFFFVFADKYTSERAGQKSAVPAAMRK